jgi:serine protease Do
MGTVLSSVCRNVVLRGSWMIVLAIGLVAVAPAIPSESQQFTDLPKSVAELKQLQTAVQSIYKKVLPAVVGIRIGASAGSGVVVSEDGFVLTAGHVSGTPKTSCEIVFPDGKVAKGVTLGANKGIDSGLIKIEDAGKWPYVEMGESANLVKGQWVIALGHPGGYMPGRTPVLRVGRIQQITENIIVTDCPLVGGDSGGPLFDLEGKVIGIHSRIGPSIAFNVHVPIKTYRETWERLVAGETWGGLERPTLPRVVDLGVRYELVGGVLKVAEVKPGSLAEKAGLKPKDLIVSVDGKSVTTADDIRRILQQKKRGEAVVVEVDRGADRLSIKVTLNS